VSEQNDKPDEWTEEDARPPYYRRLPQKERFPVLNHFANHIAWKLSTAAQAVWFHLWTHARAKPPSAFARQKRLHENYVLATQQQIAKWIGVETDKRKESSTVQRAVRELIGADVLGYLRRGTPGNPSIFRLSIPKPVPPSKSAGNPRHNRESYTETQDRRRETAFQGDGFPA
jgi:hypothetical protein